MTCSSLRFVLGAGSVAESLGRHPGIHSEVPVGMCAGPKHSIGDRKARAAPIRHDQLSAKRWPVIGVEQNRATIRAANAAGHLVLDHEQVEQLICRRDRRRPNIHEATLDSRQLWMAAKLRRIEHDLVAREPPSHDGSQQSGGWLDGERDRHGPAALQ